MLICRGRWIWTSARVSNGLNLKTILDILWCATIPMLMIQKLNDSVWETMWRRLHAHSFAFSHMFVYVCVCARALRHLHSHPHHCPSSVHSLTHSTFSIWNIVCQYRQITRFYSTSLWLFLFSLCLSCRYLLFASSFFIRHPLSHVHTTYALLRYRFFYDSVNIYSSTHIQWLLCHRMDIYSLVSYLWNSGCCFIICHSAKFDCEWGESLGSTHIQREKGIWIGVRSLELRKDWEFKWTEKRERERREKETNALPTFCKVVEFCVSMVKLIATRYLLIINQPH